jgi:hypothetical protein
MLRRTIESVHWFHVDLLTEVGRRKGFDKLSPNGEKLSPNGEEFSPNPHPRSP